MSRFLFLLKIAAESVLVNKLRGILTALGIVFGVAAVIAMLAIGAGARQFILDQMRLIGSNNIVISHKALTKESGKNDEESTQSNSASSGSTLIPWAPGISKTDVEAIAALPEVELVSPEIIRETKALYSGKILDIRCIGVENEFFTLHHLEPYKGTLFTPDHIRNNHSVCVIGRLVETRLFSGEDPIGKTIKCGNSFFTIIGVLDRRVASDETLAALSLRDYNSEVFIPLDVSLLRFGDRSRINREHIGNRFSGNNPETPELQQIDRLVVRVTESAYLKPTAEILSTMLTRRHQGQTDFSMEIPELLLQQEQKTQDMFNLVLAVIAGISLLVGGIGIMNIMLASVFERIREIGLRRAIGAKSNDIVIQFLFEAVLVSVSGGIVGILLGVGAAQIISSAADIPTVISAWSIFLSFGVAASVGLIFGIFPARKAALMDPVEALRTD